MKYSVIIKIVVALHKLKIHVAM